MTEDTPLSTEAVGEIERRFKERVRPTQLESDMADVIHAQSAALRAKDAEIERLRGALEPFADALDYYDQRYLDTDAVVSHERAGKPEVRIEVGHLRKARAALHPQENNRNE